MFKCKVCSEKDIRIAELKEQIQYFKNILHPPRREQALVEDFNETQILQGGGEEEIDLEAQALELERQTQEENLIFSGNTEESA